MVVTPAYDSATHYSPGRYPVSETSVRREGRQDEAVFCGLFWYFRPRQLGWNRPSIAAESGFHFLPSAQRTGHGAHFCCLRQNEQPPANNGLHELHRSRRYEHDYWGGSRDDKPCSCVVASRGHLCQKECGSRSAAVGVFEFSGCLCERLFPAGVAILGSHSTPRANPHVVG